MYARLEQLTGVTDLCLAVAAVYKGKEVHVIDLEGVRYYLLPVKKMDSYQIKLESEWIKICTEFQPDLVHINGTEYPHGLACMNALPELKYAVSIQGLVSIIARYYTGGMTFGVILRHTGLIELLTLRSIWAEMKGMVKRGRFELEYIRRAHAVSGRTTWDYAHIRSINPAVPYYYSPRSLRGAFYNSGKWNQERMNPHTIFLSKGTSPFKGMHQVIRAAALLLVRYPGLHMRVAGKDILRKSGIGAKLLSTAYPRYLVRLIKQNGLTGHITFTGRLSAEQMAAELLSANVFICPSAIENSSNSIAEAQMLGVPTIASDAGGNQDMIEHGVSGFLYRFEEHELLAHYVSRVFSEPELARKISKNASQSARVRHDPVSSLDADLRMYADLVDLAKNFHGSEN